MPSLQGAHDTLSRTLPSSDYQGAVLALKMLARVLGTDPLCFTSGHFTMIPCQLTEALTVPWVSLFTGIPNSTSNLIRKNSHTWLH